MKAFLYLILLSLLLSFTNFVNANDNFKLGDTWYWQLQGDLNMNKDRDIYDIDLSDTSSDTITRLHNDGKKVICYFSAGSSENWRDDFDDFPKEVLGKNLSGWAGEKWLDVSNYEKFSDIMTSRLDLAVEKGCDAVEPDNVDGYTNNNGFGLNYNDQLIYNKFLSSEAHKRGLLIGLKNDLNQIGDLVSYFDFAINEECYSYNECHLLKPFIDNNKPVFGVQYELSTNEFCDDANKNNFDFLKATSDLDGKGMKYCKENSDYEEPVEENEKDEIIKNRIRKLLVRYNISDQRALRLENNITSIIENREEVNINDKKLYILYIIREVLQEYR